MACRVRLYLELQNLTPYPIPSMFQMGPEREESSKINTCKWRKDENKCLGNTPIPPLAEWPLAGRSRDLYLANGTGPIPEEEQRRRRELTGHFVRFRLHYVPLDRRHGASPAGQRPRGRNRLGARGQTHHRARPPLQGGCDRRLGALGGVGQSGIGHHHHRHFVGLHSPPSQGVGDHSPSGHRPHRPRVGGGGRAAIGLNQAHPQPRLASDVGVQGLDV